MKGFKLLAEDTKDKTENREVLIHEPKILEVVDNRIYFYAEIERDTVLELNKTLRQMTTEALYQQAVWNTSEPRPIYLHINSFGGSLFSGLAAMDHILLEREKVPIHTIVDGCCASAGTLLSISGTTRFVRPHAFMLIHQISTFVWGKYEEFKDEMQNLDLLMNTLRTIYAEHTELPKERLNEILQHDLWFDAETCLKYKLADSIA